jgi:hypothetical protein
LRALPCAPVRVRRARSIAESGQSPRPPPPRRLSCRCRPPRLGSRRRGLPVAELREQLHLDILWEIWERAHRAASRGPQSLRGVREQVLQLLPEGLEPAGGPHLHHGVRCVSSPICLFRALGSCDLSHATAARYFLRGCLR